MDFVPKLEPESEEDEEVSAIMASGSSTEVLSKSVLVVAGEASESEEEEINSTTNKSIGVGRRFLKPIASSVIVKDFTPVEVADFTEPERREPTKYKTLLHRKLRERNLSLQKNLFDLVRQPFQSASREINVITQHLIKTQMLVQDVTPLLRQLTNDLFYLEDKIDIVNDYCGVLPDITLKETET